MLSLRKIITTSKRIFYTQKGNAKTKKRLPLQTMTKKVFNTILFYLGKLYNEQVFREREYNDVINLLRKMSKELFTELSPEDA